MDQTTIGQMDKLPSYFRIGSRLICKNNISLITVNDEECKVYVSDGIPLVFAFGTFGYGFFKKIYESYDDESKLIR
jgi:hypothetical protein